MELSFRDQDWGPDPLSAMQAAYREGHKRLWGDAPPTRLALPAVKPEPVKPVEVVAPPEPEPEESITHAASIPAPLAAMHLARVILAECAEKHGVRIEDILGKRRHSRLVLARREAFWRLHNETLWPLLKIGQFLHKDHSTCCHALQVCEEFGLKLYSVRASKLLGKSAAGLVDGPVAEM